MDKTPFDKIDSILSYICNADQPPYRTFGEVYKDNGYENNSKELIEILLKLEKDKYVHTELNSENIKRYYSTFDGRMFLAKSAYKQQKLDEEKEKNQIKEIQKIQLYLTIILAIGAAVASVYYLIEIIKSFCHCY